jgi:hypothetical protein
MIIINHRITDQKRHRHDLSTRQNNGVDIHPQTQKYFVCRHHSLPLDWRRRKQLQRLQQHRAARKCHLIPGSRRSSHRTGTYTGCNKRIEHALTKRAPWAKFDGLFIQTTNMSSINYHGRFHAWTWKITINWKLMGHQLRVVVIILLFLLYLFFTLPC